MPIHGSNYHVTHESRDDHPHGNPKGSVPEQQILSLASEIGVRFYFVNISRANTDQMVGVWNEQLTSKGVRAIDSIEPDHSGGDFVDADSFTSQISSAMLADYTSPMKRPG